MKEAQIVEKVREIVGRHALPDFITGFDVRLGESDSGPAFWIAFRVVAGPTFDYPDVEEQVSKIIALEKDLMPELLSSFDEHMPYFRYEPAAMMTRAG